MPNVGLGLATAAPDAGPETALAFARRAEEAGADSIWALDRLVFGNQDPLLALAATTATTQRVRIGTCVLLATLRPPALLAKMVGTLDQLSNGRVTLGIGVGSRPDDFAAADIPFEHRGGRAEELVEVLRAAWSGAPLRHDGHYYQLNIGPVGPPPIQAHLPIWFGGNADSALRRIARIADGYIGSSSGGPEGFRANWDKIRRHAEVVGRDPSTITPAALVYCCVDDDRERALARAAAYFDFYYGGTRGRRADGMMVGSAEECARIAQSYFDAGVQTLIIGSVTADLMYLDRLCSKVLPLLPSE